MLESEFILLLFVLNVALRVILIVVLLVVFIGVLWVILCCVFFGLVSFIIIDGNFFDRYLWVKI